MKEVTLAIKNIQWADEAETLSSEEMEEWHLPAETVLTVKVGNDDLMSRTMEAVLYSLSEKYGQPDDGIEAVDFDVDWSKVITDRKEAQEQPYTESTISIPQEDWRTLLRCAWCSAMATRDTLLLLLIIREQLNAPEGKLTRISLLDTAYLELMLEEIETEREKIKQWVKPAFPPSHAEILAQIENTIQRELDRRKEDGAR